MTTTRITTADALRDFPTNADRDAEYARLDQLEASFAGHVDLLDQIDYRRGVIETTDHRSFMSGHQPL